MFLAYQLIISVSARALANDKISRIDAHSDFGTITVSHASFVSRLAYKFSISFSCKMTLVGWKSKIPNPVNFS